MKLFRVITLVLFAITILWHASLCWSRPPSSIQLEYFKEEQILRIDVKHVSKNPRDHHIRKLIVFRNDEEVEKFLFVTQSKAYGFSKEIPLVAHTDDVIRVKATCSKAGRKEETLIIPK